MKKVIATAITIGAIVSAVGLGSAYAQTVTPTTTLTPTPSTSVTVPSGAPATGFATN